MGVLHRGVELLNRVLRPTGFVVVPRTDWVEAMLDRRRRDGDRRGRNEDVSNDRRRSS